jgi:hypothetical protein
VSTGDEIPQGMREAASRARCPDCGGPVGEIARDPGGGDFFVMFIDHDEDCPVMSGAVDRDQAHTLAALAAGMRVLHCTVCGGPADPISDGAGGWLCAECAESRRSS